MTIADIVAALDALAAAAGADDRDQYLVALDRTDELKATDEQIFDAHRWVRRVLGAAGFDHRGLTRP